MTIKTLIFKYSIISFPSSFCKFPPAADRHKKVTIPRKIYSCKSREHLLSTLFKIGIFLAYYISEEIKIENASSYRCAKGQIGREDNKDAVDEY